MNKRDLDSQIIEQIDAIIKEYDNVLSENKEKIGLDISAYYYFVSRFESIIGSLPKKGNSYQINLDEAKNLIKHQVFGEEAEHNKRRLNAISSILKALKEPAILQHSTFMVILLAIPLIISPTLPSQKE